MIPKAAWQSARPGMAATLVLLAVGFVSSSRADASCGDYVMIGGHHTMPPAADSEQDRHAPVTPRCHGPHCSDNSIPPATPAPRTDVSVERWALPGSSELVPLPAYDVLLAESQASPCEGHGLSILRPPR